MQRLVKEKSSSKAVENFLKNNTDELSDAIGVLKNVGGQIGEEFGVEESDWNLNDLIGAGEGIVGKYKERASVLVTSGTGLVEQLVKSDEGQEIKKESASLFECYFEFRRGK